MKKGSIAIIRKGAKHALARRMPLASEVLNNYQYFLDTKFNGAKTYYDNAKCFLRSYTAGSIEKQMDIYCENKSHTLRSILKRFLTFLQDQEIDHVINDLGVRELPKAENACIKFFLDYYKDHLQGERSLSTYATVLNQFFVLIKGKPELFNKRAAERFIIGRDLSDYTQRLYKAVLKAFCGWAMMYRETPDQELSSEQKKVKRQLKKISLQSLREIMAVKVLASSSDLKGYHKESLSQAQRTRMLSLCNSKRDRAIIALMAWNGLRSIEIIRLTVSSFHFKERKLEVWGKGRSSKRRDIIRLFKVPKEEIQTYLKELKINRGPVFPGLTRQELDSTINRYFRQMNLRRPTANRKYSPHSLRHTAGQIMYDKRVPLEFVRKTLRHASMENTLIYAQRAIERNYLKKMPLDI